MKLWKAKLLIRGGDTYLPKHVLLPKRICKFDDKKFLTITSSLHCYICNFVTFNWPIKNLDILAGKGLYALVHKGPVHTVAQRIYIRDCINFSPLIFYCIKIFKEKYALSGETLFIISWKEILSLCYDIYLVLYGKLRFRWLVWQHVNTCQLI